MRAITQLLLVLCGVLMAGAVAAANVDQNSRDCGRDARPLISFVEVDSFDLLAQAPLKVKGKLTLPVEWRHGRCHSPAHEVAAVVILHGTGGVDFRGNFTAVRLNRE